jgi:hypothetical protein
MSAGGTGFDLPEAGHPNAAACRSGRFDQRLAEQGMCRIGPVAGGRAMIVERLEIVAERSERARPSFRVAEWLAE